MRVIFNDKYLEALYEGQELKGKPKYSEEVIEKFVFKIQQIENVLTIKDLLKFRGLNFEALKGKLLGLYSIRVNKQYRIIFSLEKDVILVQDIVVIEALSKHYE
jgi:toxin HigB-1